MTGRSVTLAVAAALYSTTSALAQTSPAQTLPSSPTQMSPAQAPSAQASPTPTQASPTQAAPTQATQVPSPTSGPSTPDITQLVVTPEQQAKLKELAGRERTADAQSARVSEGTTLPSAIELRDLPPDMGLGPYRYAVVGQQIVVVDPDTRSIIQLIK